MSQEKVTKAAFGALKGQVEDGKELRQRDGFVCNTVQSL